MVENTAIMHYYGGREYQKKPWLDEDKDKSAWAFNRIWWDYARGICI
jgi:hypothetical protein